MNVHNWKSIMIMAAALAAVSARAANTEPVTLWTTGSALMPAWGLYPNGTEYGGSKVLGRAAAWGTGSMTWVAEFPESGAYQAWVRRYGGYGAVEVAVDDQPVAGGKKSSACSRRSDRGGSGGSPYVWRHLGEMTVAAGRHHIDIRVNGTMFDAVLFTTGAGFDPGNDALPDPEAEPVQAAPRRYRDDSPLQAVAGKTGLVIAAADADTMDRNDALPDPENLLTEIRLWGAARQYVTGGFVVRALRGTGRLTVRLDALTGPDGTRIPAEDLDLRVVQPRMRIRALYAGQARGLVVAPTPDLLLRDDRTGIPPAGHQGGYGGGVCVTDIPAHESRQFRLAVHVPERTPPGLYRGTLVLQTAGGWSRLRLPRKTAVPVSLGAKGAVATEITPGQPLMEL